MTLQAYNLSSRIIINSKHILMKRLRLARVCTCVCVSVSLVNTQFAQIILKRNNNKLGVFRQSIIHKDPCVKFAYDPWKHSQ
jgi:hypothetical protein